MGAAASILAVGFVILIVGAVIYYMTYSGKLSISKNKTSPSTRPPVPPSNGNRSVIQPVNGPTVQPINGNRPVIQPVNGPTTRPVNGPNNNGIIVQSNRNNGSPRMNSVPVRPNNGNGPSVLPNNGNGIVVQSNRNANGVRSNGPEFFVQMPSSSGNNTDNGTVSVRRGVRIETVPNGVNIVPVNEVDTNATIYRCEEVSMQN